MASTIIRNSVKNHAKNANKDPAIEPAAPVVQLLAKAIRVMAKAIGCSTKRCVAPLMPLAEAFPKCVCVIFSMI